MSRKYNDAEIVSSDDKEKHILKMVQHKLVTGKFTEINVIRLNSITTEPALQ